MFDLSANAGDGLDFNALKSRDLDGGVEHVLDKRRVLEDLKRMAGEKRRTSAYPTSLSFFTTRNASLCSNTVPVAAIRNSGVLEASFCTASRPVLGGTAGP